MASDELNAPLGQSKAKMSKQPKLPIGAPQFVAGLLGLSGLVLVVWAAVVNDPLGGEPIVIVSAKPPAGENPAPAPAAGPQDAKTEAGKPQNAMPPGAQTVTIIDGSSGQRQEVVIPGRNGAATGGKSPADTKLLETSRHGPIPRIGADGRRPSTAYAQPRALKPIEKTLPQIALVIGSIGISASGTADALSQLPPPVSLALAPYGADLEKLAARARDEGHEVLLQVPMEPFDYPDNDPGPQTLLTTLSGDQNVDRLHWLMSRFQGYVGLLNNMGARFTISEQALGPVLRDASKRGLIYVDNGTAARSVAGQVASNLRLPFAKADVLLDAATTPAEIDRALGRLETLARENGSAVGLATAQSATIARLAEWAKKVESRGFVLVPITMVAAKAKSS